jgi:hypothetical protein
MTQPSGFRRSFAILLLVTSCLAAGCLPPASRGVGTAAPSLGDGGGPSAAITPGPPTPRPSIVRPTPTPAPTFAVYTVATGDNLNSIARKFGTSARSIAYWNRATYPSLDPDSSGYRPNVLKVGWILNIIPNMILTDDEAPPLPSASGAS